MARISTFLYLAVVSVLALSAYSFITRTIVISPENSASHHFQVNIEKPSSDQQVMSVAISGTKNIVGKSILLYQLNEKISLPEKPLIIGHYQLPGATTPTKELAISKAKNGDRWNVTLKVQSDKADRTYAILPPDDNVEDGTTYIIDLPAFIKTHKR
jgi:hypothetical protein